MAHLGSLPAYIHMPKLTLWCVDHTHWRTECVRLCLFSAGVPFDDRRLSFDELWASGRLRFGTFPVLDVDGRTIAQPHAIAAYVGRITGFWPDDPWLGAKVEEVMDGLSDATDLLSKTVQEQDVQKKVVMRQRMIADGGLLTVTLAGLEDVLTENSHHGLSVGNQLSVADFAIWRAVAWISHSLDGIPQDYISNFFPRMWSLHKYVDQLACVREWKDTHPHHYRPLM
mmetsp:Transcript_157467/g.482593  ORF Transcript_157467/g.482593 Transcript_157467/m.482593 type:complete len:227 (-) Transcript_157467:175-855(-)